MGKRDQRRKTLYEVAIVEGAAKRQAVSGNGRNFVESEEVTAVTRAPAAAAVRDAVKKKYPKTVVHAAETITRGTEIAYEVDLKNTPKREMVLTPEGKILKEE